MTQRFLGELKRRLSDEGSLVTDEDVLASLSTDHALWVAPGSPLAAVRARNTGDVQAVMRLADEHRIPVVPRGAGSGLSGGATATDGCVILSLADMADIVELNAQGLFAVVQPGVINAALYTAAREVGLHYAPDPASREFSTIGGNVATNAGGLCCVSSGTTGAAVLGLEVVLPGGSVLRTGGRTVKNVAGLDLTRLIVGSEGCLGVVTEVTVRLTAPPEPTATCVTVLPSLPDAGEFTNAVLASQRPTMVEIMDNATIRAVEQWRPMDLDTEAAAIVITQTPPDNANLARLDQAAVRGKAIDRYVTIDTDEAEMLMTARRAALPALEQLGRVVLDDVGVPLDQVTRLLQTVEAIADSSGLTIGTFGHAGDGNLHPTLVIPTGDPTAEDTTSRAFTDIVEAAINLGGTPTGEHGVGVLKRPFISGRDPLAERLQIDIKRVFDPHGILNPGKGVPEPR